MSEIPASPSPLEALVGGDGSSAPFGPHIAQMGADPADWTCVLCDRGLYDDEAHPKVDVDGSMERVFRVYRP